MYTNLTFIYIFNYNSKPLGQMYALKACMFFALGLRDGFENALSWYLKLHYSNKVLKLYGLNFKEFPKTMYLLHAVLWWILFDVVLKSILSECFA